ncbi:hypothetical protein Bcen2424_3240 [Burkholderia cenocepacia HI2424]|nr:hypothetical protein Bcen2424_3240 [Burkholderia cenocepacia HI2424]
MSRNPAVAFCLNEFGPHFGARLSARDHGRGAARIDYTGARGKRDARDEPEYRCNCRAHENLLPCEAVAPRSDEAIHGEQHDVRDLLSRRIADHDVGPLNGARGHDCLCDFRNDKFHDD